MEYTYRTRGTCSRAIHFEVEDGKVRTVPLREEPSLVTRF